MEDTSTSEELKQIDDSEKKRGKVIQQNLPFQFFFAIEKPAEKSIESIFSRRHRHGSFHNFDLSE